MARPQHYSNVPSQLRKLSEACAESLLVPKWLIAPSLRAAVQWKEQVAFAGIKVVNLKPCTIHSLVMDLVAVELSRKSLEYASETRCQLLLARIIQELNEHQRLKYFCEIENTASLAELLSRTLTDLRLADLKPELHGKASLEDPDKAHDLRLLLREFEERLQSQHQVDYADCLVMLNKLIDNGGLKLPIDLILICPLELHLAELEQRFINQLSNRFEFVGAGEEPEDAESVDAEFCTTLGEVNEIDLVLRKLFENAQDTRLDQVEILHTDSSTYVPLVFEQMAAQVGHANLLDGDFPVTFGEGIPCVYSRPGRALRGWVRWIRSGFLQAQMVLMIREGLLEIPEANTGGKSKSKPGATSLAQLSHHLRRLPIGFGSARYSGMLSDAITKSTQLIEEESNRDPDNEGKEFTNGYDFGLGIYQQLRTFFGQLIELTTGIQEEAPKQVLNAALKFIERFARKLSELDRVAAERMVNEIVGMQRAVEAVPDSIANIWDWLEQLPVASRMLSSGPRPGCLHVDHLRNGGHSGRQLTFFVGMDDSRFPLKNAQDPILLDFERENLSSRLETATARRDRMGRDYWQLIERLRGRAVFSFPSYSLANDSTAFPGSTLLETWYRLKSSGQMSLEKFRNELGEPESFSVSNQDSTTSTKQWWFRALGRTSHESKKQDLLLSGFSHLREASCAENERNKPDLTQYDGLVPEAGKDLNPAAPDSKRVSPSRLETYGTCPRKFFFRYGLGIAPPDEHLVETDRWLDPLTLGSLIHDLFEEFLKTLTTQNRIPEVKRDRSKLRGLLDKKIEEQLQLIPVLNEDAFQRQVRQLRRTCDIFLRREEEHCKETNSVPWICEASVGLGEAVRSEIDGPEPVTLTLSDGRAFKVGGRIDRIDRDGGPDSLQFSIWDYKSGSSWGFDPSDPFRQGRKLQPFLYAGMLKHRVVATFGKEAKVNYFGYFFPSPRSEGLRISWTTGELKKGDEVLRQIFDSIERGVFVPTNDAKDCGYCDYQPICGEPAETAEYSDRLLHIPGSSQLDPLRKLRGIEIEDDELQIRMEGER